MSTEISWTHVQLPNGKVIKGDTWNPLLGCDKISPGCKNCYAIKTAWIRQHNPKMNKRFAGLVEKNKNGSLNWTGRINLVYDSLYKPITSSPKIYFVNSMSDLFHEDVPVTFIASVYAVMYLCPNSVFQVLTKRSRHMRVVLNSESFLYGLRHEIERIQSEYKQYINYPLPGKIFPLKNVLQGVSVENQNTASVRIPHLLSTPAYTRFLSCEPLLGNITFDYRWLKEWCPEHDIVAGGCSHNMHTKRDKEKFTKIDWIIAGGESGNSLYPTMHPDWVRSIRDQCSEYNVPFFFKQWGNWIPIEKGDGDGKKGLKSNQQWINLSGGSGMHGEEIYRMQRVTKKAAGCLLDGVIHDQYPAVIHDFKNAILERYNK